MLIILPPDIRRQLKTWLRRSGSREIGGVIMAEQIEPGTFAIRELSLDDITGSEAHFIRSPEYHTKALKAFFERTGADYSRFNYLGEWHSHPRFPTKPSRQDIFSMMDLITGERDIGFAVLLIVRLRYHFYLDITGCVFARGQEPMWCAVQ
jgi:[CysO sulfur-carrier protein]-S-L-cysteine hydrolase